MTDYAEIKSILDPIAFVKALILAPLLIALIFCWAIIPVFAVAFGAIPYLLFGTPVLLYMVTRYPLTLFKFALGGLCALGLFAMTLRAVVVFAPGTRVFYLPINMQTLNGMVLWGLPFAALWCAAFAWLYRQFYRPLDV